MKTFAVFVVSAVAIAHSKAASVEAQLEAEKTRNEDTGISLATGNAAWTDKFHPREAAAANAHLADLIKKAKDRKEDARDPEQGAVRRAKEAYDAAPAGAAKEAASVVWKQALDAWSRSIAVREEQEQKRERAEQEARISQLERDVAAAQRQAQQAAVAAQRAQFQAQQAAAAAAEDAWRQRQGLMPIQR